MMTFSFGELKNPKVLLSLSLSLSMFVYIYIHTVLKICIYVYSFCFLVVVDGSSCVLGCSFFFETWVDMFNTFHHPKVNLFMSDILGHCKASISDRKQAC